MPKILNFGSLNIDYVYGMDHIILPGETEASTSRQIFPGGKGLNQSVAAARAGAEVYHAGAVGNSDDTDILTAVLREAGVRLDYLRTHDLPTGHTVIQVDRRGQNSIILFGGANQSLQRAEIDATLASFGPGDFLVLQNETNELEYLMRRGAERGLKIAFNVSPFTPALLDLPLDLCAYLLVNELEGAGIAGVPADAPADALMAALSARLPQAHLLLTLGTRGSMFKAPGQAALICGCYKVKAVDTTASGDTFTGFFLQAVSAGQPVAAAMRRAACAAAIAVTRPGAASSIPTAAEVAASPLLAAAPAFGG